MKLRCSFNLIFEKIWVFFLVLGVYGYCLLSIYGLPHGFYEYSFDPVSLFKCYDDLGSRFTLEIFLHYMTVSASAYAILFLCISLFTMHNIVRSNLYEYIFKFKISGNKFYLVLIALFNVIGVCIFEVAALLFLRNHGYSGKTAVIASLEYNTLCYLMPAFFAIVLGTLIGSLKNHKLKYILFVLVVFYIGYGFNMFLGDFKSINSLDYRGFKPVIWDLMDIVHSYRATGYGIFTYDYQYYKILMLICLVLGLLLLRICKGKIRFLAIAFGLLSIGFGVLYFSNGSRFLNYNYAYGYDMTNLYNQQAEAGFKITDYDIKMDLDKGFRVKVTMIIDNASLDEYRFTLYETLWVDSIKNAEGSILDYDRTKPYITVKAQGDMSSITMEYHGYLGAYVADERWVFLPETFVYYPHPGFCDIANDNPHNYFGGDGAVVLNDYKSHYRVEISNAPSDIFSNLSEEKGVFEGEAYGIFFAGGPYHKISMGRYNFVVDNERFFVDEHIHEIVEVLDELDEHYDMNTEKDKLVVLSSYPYNACAAGIWLDAGIEFRDDYYYISEPVALEILQQILIKEDLYAIVNKRKL